ncbi:MAG TPA: hypothetical protein VFU15_13970, partial [Bacteroidia bacterium]|nr:hypothetical protein [Bacteroidia bacterium]
MKKNLLPVIAAVPFLLFLCCSSPPDKSAALQEQIDSLQKKLDDTYRPGFGEFMSGIQVHHAKLWFAGKEQNWKLADFELHEIMETVDDLKKYQSERRESDKLIML